MRLATFNVENMFERPAAMNYASWSAGKKVLEDFTRLNDLIARSNYTASVRSQLKTIMSAYTGLLTQGASKHIRLREIRGKLVGKVSGVYQVKPGGRGDWVGWFELVVEPINDKALLNTGRIVRLVNADVLCVVEADNRIALARFNRDVLKDVGGAPYDHAMLI